jgi:hypothetical protein
MFRLLHVGFVHPARPALFVNFLHLGRGIDRLLLLLVEFPTLGKLDFFSLTLRQMAGTVARNAMACVENVTSDKGRVGSIVETMVLKRRSLRAVASRRGTAWNVRIRRSPSELCAQ